MAAIETVANVTKLSDREYVIATGDALVGSGITGADSAVFKIRDGGRLRFMAGSTPVFTNCHFVEELTANVFSNANWSSGSASRFMAGSSPSFINCSWTVDTSNRSDWDLQETCTAYFENFYLRVFNISTKSRLMGVGYIVDGFIVNSQNKAALEINNEANLQGLVLLDNHPGDVQPHFAAVITSDGVITVKNASFRNYSVFAGGSTPNDARILELEDPVGNIFKTGNVNQLGQWAGRGRTVRTYTFDVTDAALAPLNARVIVTRSPSNEIIFDANLTNGTFKQTLREHFQAGGGIDIVYTNQYRRAAVQYGRLSSTTNFTLAWDPDSPSGRNDGAVILPEDLRITESDEAAVGAYTAIASLAQLYDRLRWLEVNRSDRHKVGIPLVSADGSTAIGAFASITIDNTAASAIAYNDVANALTIKASTLPASTKVARLQNDGGSITLAQAGAFPVFDFLNNTVVVPEGTTDLTGCTFSGTTLDNSTANPATVIVSAGQSPAIASPTTGGGSITVQQPRDETTITGLPSAANSNGIAPATVLGIYDVTGDSWTTFDASSGSVGPIVLADYATGTQVRLQADAVGYYRSAEFTFDTTDAPTTIDASNWLTAIADFFGNAKVGNGIQAEMDLITYDSADEAIELAEGTLTFPSALDKFELLTSTQTGLVAFRNTPLFDVDQEIVYFRPPVKGRAHASAANSPVATFQILSLDGADPFEHNVADGQGGIRPEVRLEFQRVALTVEVSGGLSSADRAVIDTIAVDTSRLDGLLENSGGDRFTAKALEQAPSSDATAANQTTILGDLAAIKGSGFVEATDSLESLRNRGDAAWVTADTTFLDVAVSTRSSHSAPDLSNLDTAVSTRLAASNYTAPDNTGIAAIQAKTDALPADPAGVSDLPSEPPTATANAAAVRTELATEIGRIDVATSSRLASADYSEPLDTAETQAAATAALTAYNAATAADVSVTVNGGFEASDRADLQATKQAAEAVTDGGFLNDFPAGTGTQYNTDGTVRTVFDLKDADGNAATEARDVAGRMPQP